MSDEHPGPDIGDSVLAAIAMLGGARTAQIVRALELHAYIAQLSPSARLYEVERTLSAMRNAQLVAWAWGKWKLTRQGQRRLNNPACPQCTRRGWCLCAKDRG
jgi:hypothetical protein